MIRNRLKQIIGERGMTIKELSERAGINYSTAKAMVKDPFRVISLEVVDALCKELQLRVSDILEYVPDQIVQHEYASELEAHVKERTRTARNFVVHKSRLFLDYGSMSSEEAQHWTDIAALEDAGLLKGSGEPRNNPHGQ